MVCLGPFIPDVRDFSLMCVNRMVNIAGLAALATTFLEKYVGFWAAFIPPAGAMALGMIPLVMFRTKFGKISAASVQQDEYADEIYQ